MLENSFDPRYGVHIADALDRASFHGYADIVAMLLSLDPDPPVIEGYRWARVSTGLCMAGRPATRKITSAR
jgi:hypothetical protein